MDFGVQRKRMTETKDTTDKTLRGGERKPLSLQRTVESGHVRQNFSHGRSKSVVVEKRKTRKLGGPGGTEAAVTTDAPVVEAPVARKAVQCSPGFSVCHMVLAAALAKLGRIEEAKTAGARALGLHPSFRYGAWLPSVNCVPELATSLSEAFREAGLPE